MARKITTEAVHAFMVAGKDFRKDNTSVVVLDNFVYMYLHDNIIATRAVGSNQIFVSNGGWSSNTTKERLNGIPGVSVCQRKGVWYLNGEAWNGEWTKI